MQDTPNWITTLDDGVIVGVLANYTVNNFIRDPFTQRHSLKANFYTATAGFSLTYKGYLKRQSQVGISILMHFIQLRGSLKTSLDFPMKANMIRRIQNENTTEPEYLSLTSLPLFLKRAG